MIDVVYKIGEKPEVENHEELRYSIRSVCKHFKDLGKIFIIGYKPGWIRDIIHIPLKDPYKTNKDANLINKMIMACCRNELSNYFINISDDMFFLKDIDKEYFYTPMYNNRIANLVLSGSSVKWEVRLIRTINMLQSLSLPGDCYEAHIPYLLNKVEYPKILLNFDYGYDQGYCGNTLYFNSVNRDLYNDFESVKEKTVLRLEKKHDHEKLAQASDFDFLNYSVRGYSNEVHNFLKSKFSEYSKYEIH